MPTDNPTTPLVDLKFVADLARVKDVSVQGCPTDGLGPGLPPIVPIAFDPSTGRPVSVRPLIEEYRTAPPEKRGTATALTLDALIDLTNRHKTPDSAIFAATDWRKPAFVTVVDYHPLAGGTANAKHRIAYAFPLSDEWKAWIAIDGKPLDQGEFAAWIEDRIADLTTPTADERGDLEATFSTRMATPAELMTLSRGLAVMVEAKVEKMVTLQSGAAQMTFVETHKDAAGGALTVPGLFMLSVAPFVGGERVRIPVRLRYRLAGGSVKWHFAIYRPDFYVSERVVDDLAKARNSTGLPTFEGSPEV